MDGIIVIDKDKECTSHDVVNKVKKIFNEKVGHTGTLDPNATGVLPLLVGKATKLSYYLIEHDKEYEVVLQLGKKTDTADSEGNIIQQQDVSEEILKQETITNALESFKGKQKQIPPMYSAIKVNGKKLYEYARKNIQIDVKPREIEIYDIKLIKVENNEKQIIFKVSCSKGTYIRSLCEDIATKLENIGYMKELKRTKVGAFNIEESIKVNELEKSNNINEHLISIEEFFIQMYGQQNKVSLNNEKLLLLYNGVKLTQQLEDGLYRIYQEDNKFIGIGLVKNNLLKRQIIVEKNI